MLCKTRKSWRFNTFFAIHSRATDGRPHHGVGKLGFGWGFPIPLGKTGFVGVPFVTNLGAKRLPRVVVKLIKMGQNVQIQLEIATPHCLEPVSSQFGPCRAAPSLAEPTLLAKIGATPTPPRGPIGVWDWVWGGDL